MDAPATLASGEESWLEVGLDEAVPSPAAPGGSPAPPHTRDAPGEEPMVPGASHDAPPGPRGDARGAEPAAR
eukprot:CAMPEP_0198436162 /NCGR_PEP_ID=MMETSP1452-20131203/41311_1 /TAXON_ID=1181717 /ORGANISM="Synchroma pusillum, Strain CCMP3072" /LENGTH=71 /DNA_ID=CAMNT_0044156711 /DNA_START=59 /DNA_END=270 /DNA_ORIENTATION=+